MLKRLVAPTALAFSALLAPPAMADAQTLPETLEDLERQAEDLLGKDARRAIERLLPMIETLMERLPVVIDNLPEYEMPEIMPNGDIIIRRKRDLPRIDRKTPDQPKDGIKT